MDGVCLYARRSMAIHLTSRDDCSTVCHSVSPPRWRETDPTHLRTKSSPLSMNSTLSSVPEFGLKHPVSLHRPDFSKPSPNWTKSGVTHFYSPLTYQKPSRNRNFGLSHLGISGIEGHNFLRPFLGNPCCLYSIRV